MRMEVVSIWGRIAGWLQHIAEGNACAQGGDAYNSCEETIEEGCDRLAAVLCHGLNSYQAVTVLGKQARRGFGSGIRESWVRQRIRVERRARVGES